MGKTRQKTMIWACTKITETSQPYHGIKQMHTNRTIRKNKADFITGDNEKGTLMF